MTEGYIQVYVNTEAPAITLEFLAQFTSDSNGAVVVATGNSRAPFIPVRSALVDSKGRLVLEL